MSKWTPGPWKLIERPSRSGGEFGSKWVVEARTDKPLGSPEYFAPFSIMLASEANARLIAAAPEMAEALRHALMIGEGGLAPLPETIAKWRAILAKIEVGTK